MNLLRVSPALVLNLSEIREISERDCGIYVTFKNSVVKYYPDFTIDDILAKLISKDDYFNFEKGLVIL